MGCAVAKGWQICQRFTPEESRLARARGVLPVYLPNRRRDLSSQLVRTCGVLHRPRFAAICRFRFPHLLREPAEDLRSAIQARRKLL